MSASVIQEHAHVGLVHAMRWRHVTFAAFSLEKFPPPSPAICVTSGSKREKEHKALDIGTSVFLDTACESRVCLPCISPDKKGAKTTDATPSIRNLKRKRRQPLGDDSQMTDPDYTPNAEDVMRVVQQAEVTAYKRCLRKRKQTWWTGRERERGCRQEMHTHNIKTKQYFFVIYSSKKKTAHFTGNMIDDCTCTSCLKINRKR